MVRVHGGDPEVQIEAHGMNLGIHMHKLGARDSTTVGHFKCLAVVQFMPAQIQFAGYMLGGKVGTCTTVNEGSHNGFPDPQVNMKHWRGDINFSWRKVRG